MTCDRHPQAVSHGGFCPACLLETALATPVGTGELTDGFTILVPLSESVSCSVFLVRNGGADGRLLRLKVWHSPAPFDYLERFRELRQQLGDWRHPTIVLPVAAYVDGRGRPAVLTEFRQGIPIIEAVGTGALTPQRAMAMLRPLIDVVLVAHARGLAHGSMVADAVIAHPGTGVAHLLDFGLATVASPTIAPCAYAPGDRDGLAAIARAVRACRQPLSGHAQL